MVVVDITLTFYGSPQTHFPKHPQRQHALQNIHYIHGAEEDAELVSKHGNDVQWINVLQIIYHSFPLAIIFQPVHTMMHNTNGIVRDVKQLSNFLDRCST